MSAGEELHRLLDRIQSDVPAPQKFLRSLVNPLDLVELAILLAPVERVRLIR